MTVRTKLAAILLSLVILPMLLGIAVLFSYVRDIVRDVRVYQLENIANLQKDRLEAFFAERREDAELFRNYAVIKDNLPVAVRLSADINNPQYIKAQEAINARLVAMRTIYGYLDVMLTDTSGRIISVGNRSHRSKELGASLAVMDGRAFEEGRKGVYFSRLYKTADKNYGMLITAPLQDNAGNFMGEAVFEIDAGHVLELVQDSTGMGKTGETYFGALSGDEAQFINTFHPERDRTIPTSAFFGVKRAMPMQQALRGQGGAGEAVDYLGHDVLAAWRPIPATGWGLVTKIDSSEAFAPVLKVKKFALILELVIALSYVFAAFLISRSITDPIRDLQKGAEIIGLGNLDYKVGSDKKDEIGQLSRAFDRMSESLKTVTASRDELDAEISERRHAEEALALQARHASLGADIGETLTRGDTLRGILQGCAKAMVQRLDAALVCIWTLSREGDCLEMHASAGMYTHLCSPSACIPMDSDRDIAIIARNRTAHITNSVTGDSMISDRDWAIEEGMASFAGYPLVIKDRVVGVMAMFSRNPLPDALTEALSTIADEISIGIERLRAEQSIKESEERFRLIINGAAEYAIIMLDPDGKVVSWNEGAERIKGYTSSEIIGKHFSRFYAPEDVLDGKPERELRAAASLGQFEDEDVRVRKDGSRFWADVVITALKDESGNLRGFSKVTRDITERKKAEDEIRELNEELERRVALRTAELTATNKELEAFSFSVSHDLRAPLRHINGFVELLEKGAGDSLDEKSRRYLTTITYSARQMGQIIDDLLAFSKMGRAEMHKSRVDMEKLVRGVIRDTQEEAGGRDITWNIGELPPADGDPSMLRLVMVNLISNALKFTRNKDRAEVEVGSYPGEELETVYFVRDNGVGFDMQYVDKLFGVFQRLHHAEEFEGTGIGLANVKRIINRHDGRVWAEGSPGTGATFYFSLPAL